MKENATKTYIGSIQRWPDSLVVQSDDETREYFAERVCVPTGEWKRISLTQEARHLVCDCGEELGTEERGTLPWQYHHKASLPNYCPKCGVRIEAAHE